MRHDTPDIRTNGNVHVQWMSGKRSRPRSAERANVVDAPRTPQQVARYIITWSERIQEKNLWRTKRVKKKVSV